jgi:hypothetical protein
MAGTWRGETGFSSRCRPDRPVAAVAGPIATRPVQAAPCWATRAHHLSERPLCRNGTALHFESFLRNLLCRRAGDLRPLDDRDWSERGGRGDRTVQAAPCWATRAHHLSERPLCRNETALRRRADEPGIDRGDCLLADERILSRTALHFESFLRNLLCRRAAHHLSERPLCRNETALRRRADEPRTARASPSGRLDRPVPTSPDHQGGCDRTCNGCDRARTG